MVWLAGKSGVEVIGGGGVSWPPWYGGSAGTPNTSFAVPGSFCTGVCFDGTDLVSCDVSTDIIYKHTGVSPTIASSFASPKIAPRGVVMVDGGNLCSLDQTGFIYFHVGISSTIGSSIAIPGTQNRALSFDGVNVITASTTVVSIWTGKTNVLLDSYATMGLCQGLLWDGTNLIECIGSTFYIHDGITSSILSNFNANVGSVLGAGFLGTNMVTCIGSTIFIHDGVSPFVP